MTQFVVGTIDKQFKRVVEERLISLLATCRNLNQIKQIQSQIITYGFEQNEFIAPKFATACAKTKKMAYAREIFDRIIGPNVLLWNAMFKGYTDNEFYRETLLMFSEMKRKDVRPNCFTFPVVLKSCGKLSALVQGKQVHCVVIKSGTIENQFIATTLIEMYSGGGEVQSAYQMFSEMPVRNIVAWTAIISAYIVSGDVECARRLFDMSVERDVVLWNIMISSYIGRGDMETARKLFDKMPRKDIMSWNTILIGYVNNDDLEAGEKFFEDIPNKNVFSWNGLIAGYFHKRHFFEVLEAFKRMLIESRVRPSDATLVTVLSACSRLGALALGSWVHVYAQSNDLKGNVYVGNGLIDMYSKCGSIESAVNVFDSMALKDLITWNTMIGGLAMHGRGVDALEVFHRMKNSGEKPDGITFVGLLCACSHMGLVEEGYTYFKSMKEDYSIEPEIEHYGCMVDLLARAGFLRKAVDFIKNMPIETDDVIWSTLLGACKTYKNVEIAELSIEWLIKLEPKNPANYLMLSNIYGDTRRWEDVARLKGLTKGTGVRKPPGCSLIEVNNSVTEFFSLDESHPYRQDIYTVLNGLRQVLTWYEPYQELLEEKGVVKW